MLKWSLIVLAVLVGILVVVVLVGVFLPKNHVASRTMTIAAPPARVYTAITDVDRYMTWRTDLRSVTRKPDDGKGALWVEKGGNGEILFRLEEAVPNVKVVTRIADPSLPFGGAWNFDIAAAGAGSTLTVTEVGEVYNPFFRAMQKFFFSPTASIEKYLSAIKAYTERPE